MLLLFAMLGCGNDDAADCRAGFTVADDGLCYQDATGDDTDGGDTDTAPPTVEDLLEALPGCEPGVADGRLDLQGRCADGACAGGTYAAIVEAVGEPEDCQLFVYSFEGYEGRTAECTWADGLGGDFTDADEDGLADPDATTYSLSITHPYDGGTADGLSLGTNMRCWLDGLGSPDEVVFQEGVSGGFEVGELYWSSAGISVTDHRDKSGSWIADGWVDGITFYDR